jgi:hypothetical protein
VQTKNKHSQFHAARIPYYSIAKGVQSPYRTNGADEIEPADSDLTQHAENDLNDAPEISITEPNGYYFTDADGHVKRRECLAEDLVPPNDFDANEWSKRAKKLNWKSERLKPGSLEIVNIRKRGEADKIGTGGKVVSFTLRNRRSVVRCVSRPHKRDDCGQRRDGR